MSYALGRAEREGSLSKTRCYGRIDWAQIVLNLLIDMLSSKPLWNIFVVQTLAKQLNTFGNWEKLWSRWGFLNLGTTDLLTLYSFTLGGLLGDQRLFRKSIVLTHYIPVSTPFLQLWQLKTSPNTCCGGEISLAENHWSRHTCDSHSCTGRIEANEKVKRIKN